jgi:hypothetical protein
MQDEYHQIYPELGWVFKVVSVDIVAMGTACQDDSLDTDVRVQD